MTTVTDINRAFAEKNMGIRLPYPEEWRVRDVQILEKKYTSRHIKVLLAVELIREGVVLRDICYLEGDRDRFGTKTSDSDGIGYTRSQLLPARAV